MAGLRPYIEPSRASAASDRAFLSTQISDLERELTALTGFISPV